MLAPVLVTPPADTPVSIADAKTHCRVDHTEDDALIQAYLQAAVGHLDGRAGILGRCIMQQTWRVRLDCWPVDGKLRLGFFDVTSVVLKYWDADGSEQTVSDTRYYLEQDALGAFLWLRDAFTGPSLDSDRVGAISAVVTCAMDPAKPPFAAVCHAIKLIVGHWYENREAVVVGQVDVKTLPLAVDALLAPHRRVGV